jgi:hypothetical protein
MKHHIITTRAELFNAFCQCPQGIALLVDGQLHYYNYRLDSIQLEDGSGFCFNLRVQIPTPMGEKPKYATIFWRAPK